MSQQYPQFERRQDTKINDIWQTLPGIKDDIVEIKETVGKHDKALYGVKGLQGEIVQAGIVDTVLQIPKFFKWVIGTMGLIVAGLAVNFLTHYYGWVKP